MSLDLDPRDPVLNQRHLPIAHPLLDPGCGAWRALLQDAAAHHAIPRPPGEELETLRRLENVRRRGTRALEVSEVLTALHARHRLGEYVEQWQVVDSEQLVQAVLDSGVWPLPLAGDTLLEYGGDLELDAATGEDFADGPRPVGLPILADSPLLLRLHPSRREMVSAHGHPSRRGRIHIRWTAREQGYSPLERMLDTLESAPTHAPAIIRSLCWTDSALAEWRWLLGTV